MLYYTSREVKQMEQYIITDFNNDFPNDNSC